VLEGRGTDPAAVDAAATAALEGLDPQTDAIASAEYRRLVAPVLLRRLLTAGRSEGRIPA
jgi:CO/xanthine dehydrogenase FAD-binding subunit